MSATITPVAVPAGGRIDLVVMLALSLLLLPICITHHRRITRTEGAFMLVVYAVYVAYLALGRVS